MNKSELRRLIRRKRRALSPVRRHYCARRLLSQLNSSSHFLNAKRVALYLTNDGEIDTRFVLDDLNKRGKEVYLPVLHPLKKGHLVFIRYHENTPMIKNCYGISEPDFARNPRLNARFLDVVCLPLVAFDQRGNRLGMGGGYYDRTLAFMHKPGPKPKLIGCAYEFQQLELLPAESWDIPLSAIATEQALRHF